MAHPDEMVRVHDTHPGVRSERTVHVRIAEADPERYRVLDKPACDHNGRPLPLTPHESVAETVKRRTTGRRAKAAAKKATPADTTTASEADTENKET